MYVKIHKSYRNVVAICDSELLGKKFEEGQKCLDVKESFYKDLELSKEEVIKIIKRQALEDATFNIVGEKSINCAIKSGIIEKKDAGYINSIPLILTF